MELKIRNVDPAVVLAIDRMVKHLHDALLFIKLSSFLYQEFLF